MELPKRNLVTRLVELVNEMTRMARSGSAEEWSAVELTMPQLRTLLLLQNGPRRMSDIAAFLATTYSSTTAIIDRIEEKGLIKRVHDLTDRRSVVVHLTETGEQELSRLWAVRHHQAEAIGEVLEEAELAKVVEGMEILLAAVQKLADAETVSTDPG
ncbi:MAG: MarR family transcriptional regulator [Chloroflexi bacterium]|nr:MarR family transcriptional regulator [Chloroflexota bacterium]MDA1270810.1 MarR family transcriptional regulator [Chloroflexota bacterium]